MVAKPNDWEWSSFRHYMTGLAGVVEIESFWTAAKRGNQLPKSQVSEARPGAPSIMPKTIAIPERLHSKINT
jgi:putative transposase